MNRQNLLTKALNLVAGLAFSLLLLSSCKTDDPNPVIPGDYFPLTDDASWEYLDEWSSPYNGEHYSSNILTFKVTGDTIVSGKTYKKYAVNDHYFRMIRKEGPQYFECLRYSEEEFKIIDESLPVKSSWLGLQDEYTKTKYLIVERNTSKNVKGVTYKDVIVINEIDYYFSTYNGNIWEQRNIKQKWYAKGIGEIYSYYLDPSYLYVNTKASLINFKQ